LSPIFKLDDWRRESLPFRSQSSLTHIHMCVFSLQLNIVSKVFLFLLFLFFI
jgi:hypothetical protein